MKLEELKLRNARKEKADNEEGNFFFYFSKKLGLSGRMVNEKNIGMA